MLAQLIGMIMKVRTTMVQATNVTGERIRARVRVADGVRTLTVAYDYELTAMANHARVAKLLAHKVVGTYGMLLPTQTGTHRRGYDWNVQT